MFTVTIDNLSWGNPNLVPVPSAVWLFGSGFLGLTGLALSPTDAWIR